MFVAVGGTPTSEAMPLTHRLRLRTLLALLGCGLALTAGAQLQANFTPSVTGGCSPLTVIFTNTTTGASANATYSWDFGNGNKTSTQDINAPEGATYATQQAYTVTLTVTDGGNTSVKTVVVTVYKTPMVAFSASGGKGCVPVPVTFTSTSSPGDGTVSQYFWDFGDGNTKSVTGPTVSNTYQYPGNPTVSLTVTNSYGCSATLAQPNLVAISPAVVPSFSADSPTLCRLADPVIFGNTTTGPPTLSYAWRFGDGTTSTALAPSHTYAQKGIYTVTLVATSSVGCADSVTQTAYINAADFNPSFTINPAKICTGNQVTFTDNSTPAVNPSSEVWLFSDDNSYSYYTNAYHTYAGPGSFNVTMSAQYGVCPVSVTQAVAVGAVPSLGGFLMQTDSLCGAPVVVKLTDTSKAAVSWAWAVGEDYLYYPAAPFATTQSASYTFTNNDYYIVGLTVTGTNGCTATVEQPITIQPPQPYINVVTISGLPYGYQGCSPVTVDVSATDGVRLTKYNWNFGDGTYSTDSTPTHTYTGPGSYIITLQFTNANGCSGTVSTNGYAVQILPKPVATFSISPRNPICGNTPVTFQYAGNNIYGVQWDFGDSSGNPATILGSGYTHQYTKEGTYTITMIAIGDSWYCTDTVVKVDSVVVLPAFPKILDDSNTCLGNRGAVFIADSIRGATSATWDFGDGTTQSAGSGSFTGSVVHNYARSGLYKVVLTTVDGQCSTRDSLQVYALLKQKPVLSATVDSVCGSGPLNVTISGLDTNYNLLTEWYVYGSYYAINGWQYGDGSAVTTYSPIYGYLVNVSGQFTQYTATLSEMTPGEDSIRVILQGNGYGFGCPDTSNYLRIKIQGPVVGYTENGGCYKYPVLFSDTSRGTGGVPITQWLWTFGDGATQTGAGPVSHVYGAPGNYYFSTLKVTDANGCSDQSGNGLHPVTVNGPQANFTWSPANITPGTTATFYNNSTGPYDGALWTFASDGSTSNSLYSVNHTYPNITTDTVTLVVTSTQPGYCPADTATQVIPVRNVNAAFTFTTAYVNNNNCPPVVVYFNSTSFNVTNYLWDFGDGATAEGNPNPSHTYNKPGKYYIRLTATGAGSTVITVTDSVIVKGPYASVSADITQACAPDKVTLTAVAVNAVSYTWDFGDGTVISAVDSFETHTYIVPGVYNPALILKDSLGCAATFNPSAPVVVDSLHVNAQALLHHLCDSGTVGFDAQIYSLSNGQLGEPLSYHWSFGTGNPGDTASTPTPAFDYKGLGRYTIQVTVTSAPGCVATSEDSVQVTATAAGLIAGPAEACAGDSLHFAASPARGAPTWEWLFPGGQTDTSAKVGLTLDSGVYTVQLIANWNGCADTTSAPLTIHGLPDIAIAPAAPRICLGGDVQVTAHDGQTYVWAPVPGLSTYAGPATIASPTVSSTYPVTVTNTYGCRATDSVYVFVARPFQVALAADTTLCIGDSMALTPQGAYAYRWISVQDTPSTVPLVVDPQASTSYTVVGYDKDRCFTDTATVAVSVVPRPTVQVAPVGIIPAGSSVTLYATGSPDVSSWSWTPPDYLSCTNCSDPLSTPRSSLLYTVTGETDYGCKASDTVRIRLICIQDRVAIPGAFSPNHD